MEELLRRALICGACPDFKQSRLLRIAAAGSNHSLGLDLLFEPLSLVFGKVFQRLFDQVTDLACFRGSSGGRLGKALHAHLIYFDSAPAYGVVKFEPGHLFVL